MSLKNKVSEKIEKWYSEREKHFFSSQQFFSTYDQSRRGFFSTIATLSATIGAFSFLLFDLSILANPSFLVIGDIFLIITIVTSIFIYLRLLNLEHQEFHNTYFTVFERLSEDISNGGKLQRKEISEEEYQKLLERNQDKISEYERPKSPTYKWHNLIFLMFALALFFVLISLIDFSCLGSFEKYSTEAAFYIRTMIYSRKVV